MVDKLPPDGSDGHEVGVGQVRVCVHVQGHLGGARVVPGVAVGAGVAVGGRAGEGEGTGANLSCRGKELVV